jgi:hypothetical protein
MMTRRQVDAAILTAARKDTWFVGYWLDQTGLSAAELASRLECDIEQLDTLGMCRHTIIDAEIEQIARHVACSAQALRDILVQ